MISTIKAYAWQALSIALGVALVVLGLKLWGEQLAHGDTRADRDRIGLAFNTYIGEQKTKNADAAKEARDKEQELQTAANKFQKDAYAQINRLRTERDAALDSLRKRPSRADANSNGAGLSAPAGSGAQARGCTGAELFREDAELALGIGFDAEELRVEYNKLWDIYQRARAQAVGPVKAAQ